MLSPLTADRARVADLDAEILVLERTLSALRIQRDQAQKRLNSFKYPVLTLPNEITIEVFLHFLPEYPHCPRLIGRHSPTLLTEICRKWRAIALETPALWREMLLPSANIPFRKQAPLLDLWLTRSKCCPLSIYINDFLSYTSFAPAALSCVGLHRARWENLVLYAPKLQLRGLFDVPMPLLRRLDVLVEESPDDPMTPKLTVCEAPMLRTVLLNDVAAQQIIFPWAQLTALALDKLFPRQCARILRCTVNLVHCELALAKDLRHEDVPDVTLPSLQTLTLTNAFEAKPVTQYLQTLTLPALRSFRVPESFLRPNFVDSLQSFVSKSGCTLQELCVTGTTSGSNASYCKAFPSTKITFAEWTPCSLDSWLKFS
ncbi:hypothetical protein C8R45DRAFT_552528 [Mycena sanguinolenta]|nr:hypothetical protein C8R45DRAFT_552528 [Mycena sanguinolenta]